MGKKKKTSPNWGPPNHHTALCSSVKRRLHFHLYPTDDKTDPGKLRHLAEDTWWVAELPKSTILSVVDKAQSRSSVFGSSRPCMSSRWPWLCSNTQFYMAVQWQGRHDLCWVLISALPAALFRLFLATATAPGPILACMQCYSGLETSIANAVHMSSPCFQVSRPTPLKATLAHSSHSHAMILSWPFLAGFAVKTCSTRS